MKHMSYAFLDIEGFKNMSTSVLIKIKSSVVYAITMTNLNKKLCTISYFYVTSSCFARLEVKCSNSTLSLLTEYVKFFFSKDFFLLLNPWVSYILDYYLTTKTDDFHLSKNKTNSATF